MKTMNLIASVMLVMSLTSSVVVNGQSINDILNQLQQQTSGLNINQISSGISSLAQSLAGSGANLNDLNAIQQQLAQLNQLNQMGQQLTAAAANINSILNTVSTIDWNQLLVNPSAAQSQLATLSSQISALASSGQLGTLLNMAGLSPMLQGVNLTDLNSLVNLLPFINQTILMQQMVQSQQLYQVIYQFANGSYATAVPALFQFLNVTPYLSQFIAAYNQSMQLDAMTNSLTQAYTQFAIFSGLLQTYTSIQPDQLIMSLLLLNDNVTACLNATSLAVGSGVTTIPAACLPFTNQSNYQLLLADLQRNNVTIQSVVGQISQFLLDVNTYVNKTGSALSNIDFQDFLNRVTNTLFGWILPAVNPSQTTTTTRKITTTTNAAVSHHRFFSASSSLCGVLLSSIGTLFLFTSRNLF